MTQDTSGTSCFCRLKESIYDSSGEIVFGMSDGVVSIFGLVAGMVVGAQSGDVILLAGATAAIAATVSMMAGVFLDIESERDEVRVEAEKRKAEIGADPDGAVNKLMDDLKGSGLSDNCLLAIHKDLAANPLETIQKFEDAVAGEEETPEQKVSAIVHACWMGVADFVAAMTPVVPFIFLPFAQAKIAFLFTTAALLILLGIGRAKLGQRPMLRTILETCAIAAAAAVAGAVVGMMITS